MEATLETPRFYRSELAEAVTPHVARLRNLIVNCYLVGPAGSNAWLLVDAGMTPNFASHIKAAAAERYGDDSRPAAIVLTHGHFDHVGAIRLADEWDVPVYAHDLEIPFLTGRASYPPPDPTVGGGAMARLSTLFPRKGINLGDRVRSLPGDHTLPGLEGWRWFHTPGHTAGHVSLFRDEDRTLIAGDAFVTTKQESAVAALTQKPQVSRPPAYFTTDWPAAARSVRALDELQPEVAATGHGRPMRGEPLREQLHFLAENFEHVAVPSRGRYVRQPAVSDENGVRFVPPPVPDPWPKIAGATLVGVAAVLLLSRATRARRRLAARTR